MRLPMNALSLPSTFASIGPPKSALFEEAEAGRGVLADILHIELEPNSGFVRERDVPSLTIEPEPSGANT